MTRTASKKKPRARPRSAKTGSTRGTTRRETGRRAEAKAEVRSSLIRAAFDLFTRRGFENATAANIAKAAGVSRRTLFRYFKTKEEILIDWLDPFNLRVCERLERRLPEEHWRDALRRSFDPFCQLTDADREHSHLLTRLMIESPSVRGCHLDRQAVWEERIAVALSHRLNRDPRTDYQSKLVASLAMTILTTAFRQSWTHPKGPAVEKLLDDAFKALDPQFFDRA